MSLPSEVTAPAPVSLTPKECVADAQGNLPEDCKQNGASQQSTSATIALDPNTSQHALTFSMIVSGRTAEDLSAAFHGDTLANAMGLSSYFAVAGVSPILGAYTTGLSSSTLGISTLGAIVIPGTVLSSLLPNTGPSTLLTTVMSTPTPSSSGGVTSGNTASGGNTGFLLNTASITPLITPISLTNVTTQTLSVTSLSLQTSTIPTVLSALPTTVLPGTTTSTTQPTTSTTSTSSTGSQAGTGTTIVTIPKVTTQTTTPTTTTTESTDNSAATAAAAAAAAAAAEQAATDAFHNSMKQLSFSSNASKIIGLPFGDIELSDNLSALIITSGNAGTISGGALSDVFVVGNQSNFLYGSGPSTANLFVFNQESLGSAHRIMDFGAGADGTHGDKIVLHTDIFSGAISISSTGEIDYTSSGFFTTELDTLEGHGYHVLNVPNLSSSLLATRTNSQFLIYDKSTATLYYSPLASTAVESLERIVSIDPSYTGKLLDSDIALIGNFRDLHFYSDMHAANVNFDMNYDGTTASAGSEVFTNVLFTGTYDNISGSGGDDYFQITDANVTITSGGGADIFYLGHGGLDPVTITDFSTTNGTLLLHGDLLGGVLDGTVVLDSANHTLDVENLPTLASLRNNGSSYLFIVDSTDVTAMSEQLAHVQSTSYFIYDQGTGVLWHDPNHGTVPYSSLESTLTYIVTLSSKPHLSDSNITLVSTTPDVSIATNPAPIYFSSTLDVVDLLAGSQPQSGVSGHSNVIYGDRAASITNDSGGSSSIFFSSTDIGAVVAPTGGGANLFIIQDGNFNNPASVDHLTTIHFFPGDDATHGDKIIINPGSTNTSIIYDKNNTEMPVTMNVINFGDPMSPYASYHLLNVANSEVYDHQGEFAYQHIGGEEIASVSALTAASGNLNDAVYAAVDGNPSTKYYNDNISVPTAIQINFVSPKMINALDFTTAEDIPYRDPSAFTFYGINESSEVMQIYHSDAMGLSDDRMATSGLFTFENNSEYSSYKIEFTEIKTLDDGVQIGDIGFYHGVPDHSHDIFVFDESTDILYYAVGGSAVFSDLYPAAQIVFSGTDGAGRTTLEATDIIFADVVTGITESNFHSSTNVPNFDSGLDRYVGLPFGDVVASDSTRSAAFIMGPNGGTVSSTDVSDLFIAGHEPNVFISHHNETDSPNFFVFTEDSLGNHNVIQNFSAGSFASYGDKIIVLSEVLDADFPGNNANGYFAYAGEMYARNSELEYLGSSQHFKDFHVLNAENLSAENVTYRTDKDCFVYDKSSGTLYYAGGMSTLAQDFREIVTLEGYEGRLYDTDIAIIENVRYLHASFNGDMTSTNFDLSYDGVAATGNSASSNAFVHPYYPSFVGDVHADYFQANSTPDDNYNGTVMTGGTNLGNFFYIGDGTYAPSTITDWHPDNFIIMTLDAPLLDGFTPGNIISDVSDHATIHFQNLISLATINKHGHQYLLTVDSTNQGQLSLQNQLALQTHDTYFVYDIGTGELFYDANHGTVDYGGYIYSLDLLAHLTAKPNLFDSNIAFSTVPNVTPYGNTTPGYFGETLSLVELLPFTAEQSGVNNATNVIIAGGASYMTNNSHEKSSIFIPSTTVATTIEPAPGSANIYVLNASHLNHDVHNMDHLTKIYFSPGSDLYHGDKIVLTSDIIGVGAMTGGSLNYQPFGPFAPVDATFVALDSGTEFSILSVADSAAYDAMFYYPEVSIGSYGGSFIIDVTPTSFNVPSGSEAIYAADGNTSTSYKNFDKENAGFTIHLSQPFALNAMIITTSLDDPNADPATYSIYGSNDGGSFVDIALDQALNLNPERNSRNGYYYFDNHLPYTFYEVRFPTLVGSGSTDHLEIGDIEFCFLSDSKVGPNNHLIYDESSSILYYGNGATEFASLQGLAEVIITNPSGVGPTTLANTDIAFVDNVTNIQAVFVNVAFQPVYRDITVENDIASFNGALINDNPDASYPTNTEIHGTSSSINVFSVDRTASGPGAPAHTFVGQDGGAFNLYSLEGFDESSSYTIQNFHSDYDYLVLSSNVYGPALPGTLIGTMDYYLGYNSFISNAIQSLASLNTTGDAILFHVNSQLTNASEGQATLADQLHKESGNTRFIFDEGTGILWFDPVGYDENRADFTGLHKVVTLENTTILHEADIFFSTDLNVIAPF